MFRPTLALRYETTGDQLRFVLAQLRELLLAHPRVTDDPARVRFAGFADYAMNVEIFAYVNTADWNEFLAIQEDIHLRILDIVESAGTGFAFPSRTLYHTRDGGLDAERQAGRREAGARMGLGPQACRSRSLPPTIATGSWTPWTIRPTDRPAPITAKRKQRASRWLHSSRISNPGARALSGRLWSLC